MAEDSETESSKHLSPPQIQDKESLEEEVQRRLGEKYDRIIPGNQSKEEYIDEGAWELFDAADRIADARQEGEKLALVDPLTKLPNRKAYDQALDRAYEEALKYPGTEVYLFMLDLDDFSLVNNTYGHAVGDEVLKAVADRLRAGIRPTDSPARLGGEELAVIFTNNPNPTFENQHVEIMNPLSVTDRLRDDMNREVQERVKVNNGQGLKQSVSAGIAKLRINPATDKATALKQLKDQADIALYQAKHAGKDRTVVFQEGMTMPPPTARKTA